MILAFLPRAWSIQEIRRGAAGMGLLALAMSGTLLSQQPTADGAPSATITFTLDFPQSNPTHYSITVDAAGHARYECTGRVAEQSEPQPYESKFDVSPAGRGKIFAWAREARYFAGKVDSGNGKLAFTGTKRLSYQDGQRSSTAQYIYSKLVPVEELTELFQNMAGTQEFGRRLAYYHRYQKLALDDELKHMEEQARSNELSEIQGVAPVLQEILEDPSVINVVRVRAKELIQMGSGAAGGH